MFWIWIIVALILGGCMGVLIMAACIDSHRRDEAAMRMVNALEK